MKRTPALGGITMNTHTHCSIFWVNALYTADTGSFLFIYVKTSIVSLLVNKSNFICIAHIHK